MTTDVDRIFGANGEYRENENLGIVHIPDAYTAIAEEAFDCYRRRSRRLVRAHLLAQRLSA
jgi:hypothetical protein